MNRRDMLRAMGIGTLGMAGGLTGCAATQEKKYPPIPKQLLKGYKGLATLPWFELNERGEAVLTRSVRESLPEGVDFHTHLGHRFMFAPPIDYQVRHDRTKYLIDCDYGKEPCDYNLNDYLNKIATEEHLHEMEVNLLSTGWVGGSPAAKTHTIPNLIAEMDAANISHAVLLTVVPRLPFKTNQTVEWLEAVAASEHGHRFVVFGGVNPRDSGALGLLRKFKTLGIRGVKVHPTMQQISPSDPAAMALYEVCDELDLPVFFHAGRAGIEPAYSRQFARMKNYIEPVKTFPNVNFIFGHAGARDWREAMPIARFHDNVFLEIEGQGVHELKTILGNVGSENCVFGSDWPFYPISATLARVLVATDGDIAARNAILSENAKQLLRL